MKHNIEVISVLILLFLATTSVVGAANGMQKSMQNVAGTLLDVFDGFGYLAGEKQVKEVAELGPFAKDHPGALLFFLWLILFTIFWAVSSTLPFFKDKTELKGPKTMFSLVLAWIVIFFGGGPIVSLFAGFSQFMVIVVLGAIVFILIAVWKGFSAMGSTAGAEAAKSSAELSRGRSEQQKAQRELIKEEKETRRLGTNIKREDNAIKKLRSLTSEEVRLTGNAEDKVRQLLNNIKRIAAAGVNAGSSPELKNTINSLLNEAKTLIPMGKDDAEIRESVTNLVNNLHALEIYGYKEDETVVNIQAKVQTDFQRGNAGTVAVGAEIGKISALGLEIKRLITKKIALLGKLVGMESKIKSYQTKWATSVSEIVKNLQLGRMSNAINSCQAVLKDLEEEKLLDEEVEQITAQMMEIDKRELKDMLGDEKLLVKKIRGM